jgi:hypothetical protein
MNMNELISEIREETATAAARASGTPGKKAGRGARKPRVAPSEAKAARKAGTGKKVSRAAPKAKRASAPEARGARQGSKTEMILALLRRSGGVTLKELMKATGWQAHSVRGFISIAGKKHGLRIESAKSESGERSYSVKV